jgi:hypothetical protein
MGAPFALAVVATNPIFGTCFRADKEDATTGRRAAESRDVTTVSARTASGKVGLTISEHRTHRLDDTESVRIDSPRETARRHR